MPAHALAAAFDQHGSIRAIVELAKSDLPEAAGLAQVALMSQDDEVAHAMVRRVYALALDADRSYLAELADAVLVHIEANHAFAGSGVERW